MYSLWDKLEWKEKLWLAGVYSLSLLLIFLIGYNLGHKATSQPVASMPSENMAALSPPNASAPSEPTPSSAPVQEISVGEPVKATMLTVHVAGAVKKPGLYTLPPGSRVQDALEAAGGAKSDADLDGLNLAELVSDGQKIYVPFRSETRMAMADMPKRSERVSHAAPRFPIDLNRASAEELEQLPGIGPVLAARIVELRRQRGRFQSVEELLDVRGIGPKRLEQIRPYVVVR
jgi:competence protein ComEA